MSVRLRQIYVVMVAAMQVVTGLVLEANHHDPDELLLNSAPALLSHSRNSQERQIPSDRADQCGACIQLAQRVSTPAVNPFELSSLPVIPYVLAPHYEKPSSGTPHAASNRGPPSA